MCLEWGVVFPCQEYDDAFNRCVVIVVADVDFNRAVERFDF